MKRALGRGLGALLPPADVEDGGRLRDLAIESLVPNPQQPRRHFDEQALEASATRMAASEQPGRKHARVVDHEHISRPQPLHHITNHPHRRLARSPVEHEQPRRAALGGRMLRDLLRGQVEVELVKAHAWGTTTAGGASLP